jgi:hypothetical protein
MPGDETAILCDRGTIDGLAYWPLSPERYFSDVASSLEAELARYDAVIHLRTPGRGAGYHKNGVRTEAAEDAEAIDDRLLAAWNAHPHRFIVENSMSFMDKARRALSIIDDELLA